MQEQEYHHKESDEYIPKLFEKADDDILVEVYADCIQLKKPSNTLQISRETCLPTPTVPPVSAPQQSFRCYALYGLLELPSNTYLLLVTRCTFVTQLFSSLIYLANHITFFGIRPPHQTVSPDQDEHYINGVSKVLNSGHLYFCYKEKYDLTGRFQGKPRNQYFWNQRLLEHIPQQWITKFISGVVKSLTYLVEGIINDVWFVDYVLVSRRDNRRIGRRWFCRGTDPDGNAANTVETEQMLIDNKGGNVHVCSYVQLRGSIPVSWCQEADLTWRPQHKLVGNQETRHNQFMEHFKMVVSQYKKMTIINLVGQKGLEGRLSKQYSKNATQFGFLSIKYVQFDFNRQLKQGKEKCKKRLLEVLQDDLNSIGYGHYHSEGKGQPFVQLRRQNGVFRTNCIDCIDRTNLAQTIISRAVLHSMLSEDHLINQSSVIKPQWFNQDPPGLFEAYHRIFWCQNADQLSRSYTGTPALKTEQVLYGHNSFGGVIKDAQSSITRYWLGNFYDARIQDYIDVSLKYIEPRKRPFNKSMSLIVVYLALLIGIPLWILFGYQKSPTGAIQQPDTSQKERIILALLNCFGVLKLFQSFLPKTIRDSRKKK